MRKKAGLFSASHDTQFNNCARIAANNEQNRQYAKNVTAPLMTVCRNVCLWSKLFHGIEELVSSVATTLAWSCLSFTGHDHGAE
eukprot:6184715-Pleurochrysis_carterae.AAC.3